MDATNATAVHGGSCTPSCRAGAQAPDPKRHEDGLREPTRLVIPTRFLPTFCEAAWTRVGCEADALREAAEGGDDDARAWTFAAVTEQVGLARRAEALASRKSTAADLLSVESWWACMTRTVEEAHRLSVDNLHAESRCDARRGTDAMRAALETAEWFGAARDELQRGS